VLEVFLHRTPLEAPQLVPLFLMVEENLQHLLELLIQIFIVGRSSQFMSESHCFRIIAVPLRIRDIVCTIAATFGK
jgi:hypothetical protein